MDGHVGGLMVAAIRRVAVASVRSRRAIPHGGRGLVAVVTASLVVSAAEAASAQADWPSEEWPKATPESVGLDRQALDGIDADIRAGRYGYVDRLLVIRHGHIAYDRRYRHDYERIYGDSARLATRLLAHDRTGPYNYFNAWWHPYYRGGELHTLQSVTKTITSIVIGTAVTRGEFPSLETPVLSFFDESAVANVDRRKRRMTIRHLLTMTAGLDWDEERAPGPDNTVDQLESSYDWVKFTIDRPMAEEPGARFNYNSGATMLLAHVFHRAVGLDIEEYAARHLFAPLRIRDWYWKRSPSGAVDTQGGLYLAPEDLARLWHLFLRAGVWDGRQVLSRDWVRSSVTPAIVARHPPDSRPTHYGFKWWLPPHPADSTRRIWAGNGFGGQFPLAFPDDDLIVIINQWNILDGHPALTPPAAIARVVEAIGPRQATPVRAEPNDQRRAAGRMIDGELVIELEAVETEWYPRAPDGPPVLTPAFAEVGRPPQVPGPLIRAAAGTPIRVNIRNRLARPIAVRGLIDRTSVTAPERTADAPVPAFLFAEALIVEPEETRATRFTPAAEVSSFYFARTLDPRDTRAEARAPSLQEGAFMGALVIDPTAPAPGPEERVLMITRWNGPGEGGTWKMFMNGLSWPFSERLHYTVGDTVRWRVINASTIDHPMHLHGFYFTVDALGDTNADTAYAQGARPLVVTQTLQELSAMRVTWVPDRPGNWLFHCHLIRHMGEAQLLGAERRRRATVPSRAPDSAAELHDETAHRDDMAGLITGITVHAAGDDPPDESAVRRVDLWTGQRPGIFDGAPELGFIVQEGAEPPASDSTRVPGSPLVLTRGEPTEIVVHNRLEIPLAVHWHGLELRSLYDGVGHWSGHPGATRPPVAPGDSVRVLITPPRAGTFMYHTHGEPGHELAQGLYGAFLVLDLGERRDPDGDRVFVLAARGATRDAPPAINGRTHSEPERFAPGRTYRLRFLHISPDESKRIRLLKDGEPVQWRPLARDGAHLPEDLRVAVPASLRLGVGETYDVEWSPAEAGVYVLEVTTDFFPALGGSVVQHVAFAVGDVAESELDVPPPLSISVVTLRAGEHARYAGTYVGYPPGEQAPELVIRVDAEDGRLFATGPLPRGVADDGPLAMLLPLGDHRFAPARDLDGLMHPLALRYRFIEADSAVSRVEVELDGRVVLVLDREGK